MGYSADRAKAKSHTIEAIHQSGTEMTSSKSALQDTDLSVRTAKFLRNLIFIKKVIIGPGEMAE